MTTKKVPDDSLFTRELETGKTAVMRAMAFTRRVQHSLTDEDTLRKGDRSPVTIADFAAQAIVCEHLHRNLPGIPIVAEEDSSGLRQEKNRDIRDSIQDFIQRDPSLSPRLGGTGLFEAIDLGNGEPDNLFWTLDPIDGTKGFLRGAQYAVALALLKEGEVVAGILGCPSISFTDFPSDRGYLFFGSRGRGAKIQNLATAEIRDIQVSRPDSGDPMRFVQSYETAHGDFEVMARIARALDITSEPLKVDSQVKYGIVASGRAQIYLRIPNPKTPDYREKIWDHAAGSMIVREAGGSVSDIHGRPLDFSRGKTLGGNTGVLVTLPAIRDRVLSEIKDAVRKGRS